MEFFKKKTYEEKLCEAVNKGKVIPPKLVMISPTDSCNLACKFCWRHEKDEDPNNWKEKELTFEEIRKIIVDCADMGVETIDLTGGGEAFVRQDILDIIKLIKEKGMKCTLTSNSTVLTADKIRQLVKLGLDDICFSLESIDESVNDSIRGKGVHEKVMKALALFTKIKAEESKTLPAVRIGTVITGRNYSKLTGLGDFASQNKIASINFSVLLEWKSNKELSVAGKEKAIMDELQKLDKLLDKKKVQSNIKPILKHGFGKHATPESCYAPWQMLFINSQGEVLACCILASFYENSIGNVRKESIKKIWTGNKMQEFRQRIKSKEWFSGCERCLPQFVEDFNEIHKRIHK